MYQLNEVRTNLVTMFGGASVGIGNKKVKPTDHTKKKKHVLVVIQCVKKVGPFHNCVVVGFTCGH